MTAEHPPEPRPCIVCGAKALSGRRCPKCGAPVPARFVGVTVSDKFLVERLLGQGGMGSVYEALHLGLDEQVAVKFLSGPWAAFPEARARFKREVMALVRLRHPGIVSILDAGEHEGTPYMVMELLRGQTLGSVLAGGKKPMALGRAVAVFDQIFEVLDAAHRVGVVHRDLKPDNVFLLDTPDRSDRVKLLDFGIAKLQVEGDAGVTRPGTVEGTPYYMSPEQCRGQSVGPPTDVYAAGVMFFEALTGDLPFVAPSITEIMAQHLYVPAPKLGERGVRPSVPAGVEALVQSILAKEPAARPTAAQAREDLAAAARGADAATQQASAAVERQRVAVLSRSQRALTLPKLEPTAAPAPGSIRALVWHPDPARASVVAGALGAGGLAATPWNGDAPPPSDPAAPVRVVLLPSGARTAEQLRELRQHPTLRAVPVLVFDIARADEVPTHIRAGASDAVLAAAGDAELAPKALRLARRGR